jgi:beta-N-acetylhexosaminidase
VPTVDTRTETLAARDFRPFAALADAPWAMTAHVVYGELDRAAPATTSATVVGETIRGAIGFQGVLISDDLSMKALAGDFRGRAAAALAAGCDLVLHCNGKMHEMAAVAEGTPALNAAGTDRVAAAEARRRAAIAPDLDRDEARAELDALLA